MDMSSCNVRLVVREDGDWQFMCGGADHYSSKDGHHVIVGVLLDFDPSLNELADLLAGWEAERKGISSPWIRTKRNGKRCMKAKTPA